MRYSSLEHGLVACRLTVNGRFYSTIAYCRYKSVPFLLEGRDPGAVGFCRMRTIHDVILKRGNTTGFDYLRLILALSVIAFHTIDVCYGWSAEYPLWKSTLRPLFLFVVPSFFALSGFLVAGSLERNTLPAFLSLRVLRIFPALAVEVILSALILGPLVTTYTLKAYFSDPQFRQYFLNVIGDIHYSLPGVFTDLPAGGMVNAQLWTIPYELECYIGISVVALFGLARRAKLLFALCCLAVVVQVGRHVLDGGWPPYERPPGHMLVAAFFFGVCIYLLRRRVPYSAPLFFVALAATWILSMGVQLVYIAMLPLAYVTIFLGLQDPKKTSFIKGADYSYGIYLYGFPIQQTVVLLFPSLRFPTANFVISAALAWLCACASWHLIESRVLARKRGVVKAVNLASEKLRNSLFPLVGSKDGTEAES
jgi:peptidoglycan/LPS O-acetylase OafA/YrhL